MTKVFLFAQIVRMFSYLNTTIPNGIHTPLYNPIKKKFSHHDSHHDVQYEDLKCIADQSPISNKSVPNTGLMATNQRTAYKTLQVTTQTPDASRRQPMPADRQETMR